MSPHVTFQFIFVNLPSSDTPVKVDCGSSIIQPAVMKSSWVSGCVGHTREMATMNNQAPVSIYFLCNSMQVFKICDRRDIRI